MVEVPLRGLRRPPDELQLLVRLEEAARADQLEAQVEMLVVGAVDFSS
jgi:hypothetical protein